ncbi:carboxypeptidase regulatory-like domain-containing protein [Mucilaginibacter sp. PAMB04168]|uniref:TonB-dependent receptor n=1 Tax=Mucilaginibacter sp. PAMB04168 TaxID=3138567 RepID=UPI0031F60A8C
MRKNLLLALLFLFTTAIAFAQVTTGTITGTVKDSKGQPLPGTTVVATHVPTGTNYSTVTRGNGQYTIPNVRAGGPYTIKITFVGFTTVTYNDLAASLGQPLKVDAVLLEEGRQLSAVTVNAARRGSVISPQRTGTATNVSSAQLQSLPTVNRNIQDFARLTPQGVSRNGNSDGSAFGMEFAGQSNKYNQFTIDGALSNDAFGLASSGTNGGQASTNPISIEAIQELQILLSPYDVTQGGFTGGGINAVTKSGTNTFHGSVYGLMQNEDLLGKSVLNDTKYQQFKNQTAGISLGGPIIKNKLFFFGNYERIRNSTPLQNDPTIAGSGSQFNPTVLEDLRNYVLNTYKYDVGGYGEILKRQESDYVFGRLDWNINDKNRLTVRHNYTKGFSDNLSRTATTMTFANSGYTFNSKNNSSVVELNSTLSNNASNVLRFTYTSTRDFRTTGAFPSVYIQQNGLNYNLGSEASSARNRLSQDNFTITDNFTLYKNKHTITFGTDNFFYKSNNIFVQNYYGYYNRYTTIQAFKDNTTAPTGYNAYYSVDPNSPDAPSIVKSAQLSVYGQDVWSISDRFRLTYGLRVDAPIFFNDPAENPTFNNSNIAQQYDLKTNRPPSTSLLFAPRAGFNWDIHGDASTQLRGGAGLFTGRVPYVWISNQYGATGATIVRYTATGAALAPIRFNYNPNDVHLGATLGSSNAPNEIDVTDKNFKFTQTLRANFAVDQKLGFWGLIGTFEALYTKKINDILYQNLNVGPQVGTVKTGNVNRPFYNGVRANTGFTDIIYLTNTSKGSAYNLTWQVQKPMSNGWVGSLAYTFGHSTSMNDGTSSTAYSNWRFAYSVNGQNNLDLATSNYDPGSRFVGYISKTFRYLHNRMATTFGLVYTGQSGQVFSWLYNGDIHGDDASNRGSGVADLAYVPATLAEAQFGTTSTFTVPAAQQWADFQAFIAGNEYLSKHQGRVVERNGDRLPWENHFDLKVSQDFYVYKQHKLSITADVLNVGNLLKKSWGRSYFLSNLSAPLFYNATTTANPQFYFDKSRLNSIDGKLQPYQISDFNSRWRAQLSVRYSF